MLPRLQPKAGQLAEEFLKSKGVEVLYNTPYDEKVNDQYDLVYVCAGQQYHSDFLKKHFAKAIAPNGQIYVNDYL